MKKKDIVNLLHKRAWYLLLLILGSIYVFHYRNDIYQLKELNAMNLIFILWLVILILPLFSEIEILGIKLKKELEKTKEEFNGRLNQINSTITELKIANSNANTINLGNSFLPSEDKLQQLFEDFITNDNLNKDENSISMFHPKQSPSEHTHQNNSDINFGITDDTTYLFKVRLMLEKTLEDLCEQTNYIGHKSLIEMVKHLNLIQLIDGKMADLLYQIIKISNRGVHGEIISKDYIDFIHNVLPELQKQLNAASYSIPYSICPECGSYVNISYFKTCPYCGIQLNEP